MSEAQREIQNPRTGQHMRFLLTAADTDGQLLRTETVNPSRQEVEPLHVHPHQESRARVVSGCLRFFVAGEESCLGPGDAITIPAATPHYFAVDGPEDAIAIQEFRPALRSAEFFRTYFAMAARGELDEKGKPSLLRSVLLGPEFADEIRLVSPPWPLQRLAYALLAPIARLRGYALS